MDITQLYNAIFHAADRLGSYWQAKVITAGLLAAMQFHFELLTLFVLLIVIDLATKWIELSYNNIKTEDYEPGIIDSIRAIPAAHRAGIISSRVMKTQFCGKIIVYCTIVIAGSIVDDITIHVHMGGLVMPLCVSYLAASELLSIIENLNDAGVSAVAGLVRMVKERRIR